MDRYPIYAEGYKNVFCPYYSACLDHAVKHYWEHWTCSECHHKDKQACISIYQTPQQGHWVEAS